MTGQLRPFCIVGTPCDQSNMGWSYETGHVFPQDYVEAIRWYRKAAKRGDAVAKDRLTRLEKQLRAKGNWPPRPRQAKGKPALTPDYKAGWAAWVREDYLTALKLWRPMAEQGDGEAQRNIGEMYYEGWGVTKDYAEAVKWYRKAAKQNVTWAGVSLNRIYEQLRAEGNWPPRSRQAKAKPTFTPDFQYGIYAFRKGDYATAVKNWRPLAEQGNANAQTRLGETYRAGLGVTKDFKEAAHWYRKAAKQGDAFAQYNLGLIYHYGLGVTKDYKEAIRWYRKVPHLADAQFNIALLEKTLRREGKLPPRSRQASKPPAPSASKQQKELERLRRENARLKKEKQAKPKKVAKKPKPSPKNGNAGSGFFISKAGHVITNQHVVNKCKRVTVGDNARKQVAADILETDRSNDLALLKISSTKMASAETKSLMRKLGIKIVPLASEGLMRSEDVELGEDLLVAGYPYGEIFSSTIKVTTGIVSAMRGLGDDSSQFQMSAPVQPGSSGGPIYDGNGNIVGVVIAQLNKRKFEKEFGSMPENVNFGIKASTVRQFLKTSGLPTKWSRRSKPMTTKELAKVAKSQTVMVMCHR